MIRAILLRISESKRLAPFIMRNSLSRKAARRFVAGETIDDAVAAAREVNRNGAMASLDLLGENVRDEAGARRAASEYAGIFDRIAREQLDANVSLKLTQLGLDLDENLCRELLQTIAARAAQFGNFVRVDMEASAYTQRTVDIVKSVRANYECVGTVLQAYLYRTESDLQSLLHAGCRIRVCKGAYNEPTEVAFEKKSDVDANYIRLMKRLLGGGLHHAIATHDPAMIRATREFVAEQGLDARQFEFQMLYGIRTDLQKQLVREGFRLRVYIPFGADWFPYFMRRLAERPANLKFLLRNLLTRRTQEKVS